MPRLSQIAACLLLAVALYGQEAVSATGMDGLQAEIASPPSPEPEPARREAVRKDAAPRPERVETNVADGGTNGDILFTSPSPYSTSGVVIQPKASWPNIAAKLGDAAGGSAFSIFDSANVRLLSVNSGGRVGINTAPHSLYQLFVANGTPAIGGALYAYSHTPVTTTAPQTDHSALLYAYQDVATGVVNDGSLTGARTRAFGTGGGTIHASYGLYAESGMNLTATGTINVAHGIKVKVAKGAGTITSGYGLMIDDVEAATAFAIYQRHDSDRNYFAGAIGLGTTTPTAKLHVVGDAYVTTRLTADGEAKFGGKVGIGLASGMAPSAKLDVAGDMRVSGAFTGSDATFSGTVQGFNIKAKYQDVAEWVPSTTDLAPGTVVVLNTAETNEVMASTTAYDLTVAGVVSAQPGLALGEEGPGKEQIATTGRVLVRVDARNAAIAVGDLLVTSDLRGTAMRSEPLTVNGRQFHQPGTIIGKALQPLHEGVGEILVLLSMQ